MLDSNRADEKKILETINRVVQLLIELSYTRGTKKNALYDDAVKLLKELRPNLLGLIDGREELLESLTRQLISQKLPHPFIFSSFGDLQRDLSHILELALHSVEENNNVIDYTENPPIVQQVKETICAGIFDSTEDPSDCSDAAKSAETAVLTELIVPVKPVEPVIEHPPQNETGGVSLQQQIQTVLENAYAGETVYKNYVFRSLLIDYYMPARKLGIIIKTSSLQQHKLYDYLLKKEGIRLFEINPDDSDDAAKRLRQLPR